MDSFENRFKGGNFFGCSFESNHNYSGINQNDVPNYGWFGNGTWAQKEPGNQEHWPQAEMGQQGQPTTEGQCFNPTIGGVSNHAFEVKMEFNREKTHLEQLQEEYEMLLG